jgi:epoxyqueuosine reductase QueG
MGEQEFAATFRRSAIRRAKHAGFLRNIRIALLNLKRNLPVTSLAEMHH